jgi:hypothetical protein
VAVEVDPQRQIGVAGLEPHVDASVAVGHGADELAADHHRTVAEAPVGGLAVGVIGLEQLRRPDRHRLLLRVAAGIDPDRARGE